jgi:hypothetical protein
MKAAVFVERGGIVIDEKPVPAVGPGDALVDVATTEGCLVLCSRISARMAEFAPTSGGVRS